MSGVTTRPYLAIYVIWHPRCEQGDAIAGDLHDHYRRNLFTDIAGGAGLSVQYRSQPLPGSATPIPIDLDDAEATAIVVLVDENLRNDPQWVAYVQDLARQTEVAGLRTLMYPVAMDDKAFGIGQPASELNFLRWYTWTDDPPGQRRRNLVFQLTYQFCRMLRMLLASLEHPEAADDLEQFLKPVRIFLSHSKHDEGKLGEAIAVAVREELAKDSDLATFFDVVDIPPGLPFAKVLLHYVRVSAVVAIHTDSYSSREWCRREILEAKRHNVPLVVANCVTDVEERSFPYMGNVPVIRMEPQARARGRFVIGRLLDEVMKDFLWRCRTVSARRADATVVFLPRPPELVSIAELARSGTTDATVVYPDPPIGNEELDLFAAIAGKLRLRSFTQWLGAQP